MNRENNNKEQWQASQQRASSAENRGQDRSEQQQNSSLTDDQRQNIGNPLAGDRSRLAGSDELGQLSSRDDAAGGSSDRMENQSTGERTDR